MSLAENIARELGKSDEQKISFTLMEKAEVILTKRMKLIDGAVEKDSSECWMSRGRAETVTLTLEEFGPFMQGLQSNQAIVHGVGTYDKARIVSRSQLTTKPGETPQTDSNGLPIISRTKDFFHYPTGPGLLMLDHDKARDNAVALDSEKALKAYSPEELITIIAEFLRPIQEAARVSACSTSSCIYDADTGKELRGKSAGFHLYLFPKKAADAPRFLEVLGKRFILAGYGRVEFSRSGAELIRTPVDLLVASPERLDFVAGAVCDKGLEQRLPAPVYHPGGLLDTEALHDLTPDEKKEYQEIIRELKAEGAPDQERIKGAYLEQEAGKLSYDSGGKISMKQARETVTARQQHILVDDDLLFFAHKKEPVNVGHVLANSPEFDNKTCSDPLEPEYDGGSMSKAVFYWNDGQNPLIYSHAHGGITYRFRRYGADKPVDYDALTSSMEWKDPLPIQDELPEVEPMREGMIPDSFRAWVTEAADRMQVPVDYLVVPLLVVCGSVIGTSCRIRPKQKDDWSVVPNLWGGIVGPPSMMKSPALDETVNKTLGRLEAEAGKEFQKAQDEYTINEMIAAAEQKKLKDAINKSVKAGKNGDGTGRSPAELAAELQKIRAEKPVERRYKTNDSSIEKIVELLRDNPRGLLYFRDELIALFRRMERSGNEQDRAFMLEAWSGHGSHIDDRIGRGTVRAENICISLLGSIQPDKIAEYLNRAVANGENDGFVQRLQLMVYPDPVRNWQYIDQAPDNEARNRAYRVIEALAELAVIPSEITDEKPFLRFSEEGQTIFQDWLTRLQREKLEDENDHPIILEHLAKYRSLMPSLALIFHLIDCTDNGRDPDPISEAAAGKAAEWCDYLESHARRIYSLALNTGKRGGETLARKIKSRVLKDGFKLRDIQMKKWSLLSSRESIQDALDWLAEKHWIQETEPERSTAQGGRPPASSYRINPKIFSS